MGIFKVLLLAGGLQALLIALYFFYHKGIKGTKTFGFLLLVLATHLFLVANDNREFFMEYPHLLHISWVLPGLYGPLNLIFIRRITRHQLSFSWKELLFFLPVGVLVYAEADFYTLSAFEKQQYIQDFMASVSDDFGWHNELVAWIHVVFFSLSLWFFLSFRKLIREYASTEEARLAWLFHYLIIALTIIVFGLAAFYGRKLELPILEKIYPNHFILVVLLIYWSAYRLIRQPIIFQSDQPLVPDRSTNTERTIQPHHEQLAREIRRVMEDEELYKRPGLTLYELVSKLGSNKQYVSETINLVFGKSFYDYVNELRLNDFVKQIKQPDHHRFTLLGMAFNSGFNSKATFNAVFKKYYGMAPSHFYKNQLEAMELSPN